ncbi:hypothetical protein F511_09687 [Dorcoceras hygrometricum]|uniref:Uncharacterized protein n=1 Tax=Dorcoceras hygrometricum TaxID=472368 RepID=A0A2Z7BZ81_9LAMI|nr:hypothetical protein F511_09687 [Dorcoceras hygrometricum]
MRELRVTSCGFGKTVKEVERRRFVKLKRCVLEPPARGLWYLKFSGSKTMSFEEVDTTAFRLRAKDSADGLCDDQTSSYWTVKPALTNKEFSSWTFSKANPTADDLEKQFQLQRFSSNDQAVTTQQRCKISNNANSAEATSSSPRSRFLYVKQDSLNRKLHHGNSKRFLTRTRQISRSNRRIERSNGQLKLVNHARVTVDFIFSTIQVPLREARFFEQKASPWKFKRFLTRTRQISGASNRRIERSNGQLKLEMAPSAPRTRAAAALRMKQIALDNQDRTIRRLRAQLATERRGLATTKKELEETRVALEASHKVIAGLTEIGLSMSKKIERMKVKKQLVRANHVECHQKFQARIHEAEDSMQAQHLLIEALVDEKDSLLQTIHDRQEANNAPTPFNGDWEEEPEEEEIEDIPLGEGEIDDE